MRMTITKRTLEEVHDHLRKDPEVVKVTVSQNGDALYSAHEKPKKDLSLSRSRCIRKSWCSPLQMRISCIVRMRISRRTMICFKIAVCQAGGPWILRMKFRLVGGSAAESNFEEVA
jgi:hypothetical protein